MQSVDSTTPPSAQAPTVRTSATTQVTDLFGNVLQVTDLDAAIAERQMCVDARTWFYTRPFKYDNGIKVDIPERTGEKIPLSQYHEDLLTKLQALKAQLTG